MKNIVTILLLSCCCSFTIPATISIIEPVKTETVAATVKNKKNNRVIKPEAEKIPGRKLKPKEKLIRRLQKLFPDFSPEMQRKANNQAITGFVMSIVGLFVFSPLLIASLILSSAAIRKERENPGILQKSNYRLARAGKIISIIGLVIFVLTIFLVVIILTAGPAVSS